MKKNRNYIKLSINKRWSAESRIWSFHIFTTNFLSLQKDFAKFSILHLPCRKGINNSMGLGEISGIGLHNFLKKLIIKRH